MKLNKMNILLKDLEYNTIYKNGEYFRKLAKEKVDEMADKTWEELKPTIEGYVQSLTKAGDDLSAKAQKVKEDAQITENILTDFSNEIKKILKNIDKTIKHLEVKDVA